MAEVFNLPFWEDTIAEPPLVKNYYLPDKADVVIIGAGIQGLLLGYVLGVRGLKCHIFDGAPPGVRSSLKGDGIIGLGPCAFPSRLFHGANGTDIVKLINLSVESLQYFKEVIGVT